MKKLLVILIVFLSLSLVLVGCTNDNEVDEDDGNVEEDIIDEDDDPAVEPEPDLDNEDVDEDSSDPSDSSDIDSILSKSNNINEYYYEYDIEAQGENMTTKMWYSNNKIRSEMNLGEQGKMVMIINNDTKEQYIYYPDQNMAMKMPVGAEVASQDIIDPSEEESLKDYVDDINQDTMEVIDEENYNGQKVKVIEFKDGDISAKMWISEKHGLPLKSETYENGNLINTMEIKNFKEGPFEESLFEIPEGVEIQDLSNMGEN